MEQTMNKKTSKAPFLVLTIATLAVCIVFFIGLGGYIATAATAGITFDQFLNVLYASGGMVVICITALMIVLLVLKTKREVWAKVFVWGALLLSMLASAGFYGNLSQLTMVDFTQGLGFVSRYAPYIALSVASVALIVQWDNNNRKATNLVSLVCWMVSAVMVVFQIKSIMEEMQNGLNLTSSIDPVYLYQYIMLGALAIALALIVVVYFYVTLSRRSFDRNMLGLTDEEAEIVERIEERVDEIADEVEEMAALGEAVIAAKQEIEKEAHQAAEETAADTGEEAGNEEIVTVDLDAARAEKDDTQEK